MGWHFQLVKKASQSLLPEAANKVRSFSVGAYTWQKIQLRLQVCELCVSGKQGVRAADCKSLSEKPEGVFDSLKVPALMGWHFGPGMGYRQWT